MRRSIDASAPFGVVLVMDPDTGMPPETMDGQAIAEGASSIAVGTLADADGPTRFVLGDLRDGAPVDDLVLRWEGSVRTSGRLAIVSVDGAVLLEADPPVRERAHVQIWTNHESEPDVIWVAVGDPTHHAFAGES